MKRYVSILIGALVALAFVGEALAQAPNATSTPAPGPDVTAKKSSAKATKKKTKGKSKPKRSSNARAPEMANKKSEQ